MDILEIDERLGADVSAPSPSHKNDIKDLDAVGHERSPYNKTPTSF